MQQLLREIRELGYPGSSNLLVRYLNQGRADAERPHIARGVPGRAAAELKERWRELKHVSLENASALPCGTPTRKHFGDGITVDLS